MGGVGLPLPTPPANVARFTVNVGAIWELASLVLDEVSTRIAATDASLLPARQDIWSGPGWGWAGCDQLAVHPVQVEPVPGLPGGLPASPTSCAVVPAVTLAVSWLVCVPTVADSGNPPTSASLATASERVLRGGAALYTALTSARKEKVFGDCSGVTLGIMESVGPLGGIAGWRMSVVVDPDPSVWGS